MGAHTAARAAAAPPDDPHDDPGLQGAIAAHMATGVALIRASDGIILHVNPAWERMFGFSRADLVGRHISVVNAPTEVSPQELAAQIADALAREGAWRGEVHNVRSDGTRFWSEVWISTFESARYGTVWITVQVDGGRRQAAAQALRDAEARYRTAFEDGPVGMVIAGGDGRIEDANRAFCDLTGYRRDELAGRALADLGHPDDARLDEDLAARVLAGEIQRYRVVRRLVGKDGAARACELTGSVARDPDGRALHWTVVVAEAAPERVDGPAP